MCEIKAHVRARNNHAIAFLESSSRNGIMRIRGILQCRLTTSGNTIPAHPRVEAKS